MNNSIKSLFLAGLTFLSIGLAAQEFDVLQYRTVGPGRGGRVTAVVGTPIAPSTFYLGATGGGVWKTEDYGTTWDNVSDGFFASPSIGAIDVAEHDANIVYVGTGSDGIRSNVIAGKGMYKSIDAGKTWDHIGLDKTGHIGAVEIDPTNHNIVWVAAIGNAFKPNPERGVYKTTDGGASWEKVLFISDKVGIVDIELLPGNPNVIYAAAWKVDRKPWTIISGGKNEEGGIYKSINGGKSWEKLSKGLPQGLIGKIDLAVSPSNSSIVYAVIEAPGKEGGLYKSEDQGKSFVQVSSDNRLVNRPFYYCNVTVDPINADIIYSMANPMVKSTDGGQSWSRMNAPHGDHHDLWINPNNPDLMIQCNDGGANISHNGGQTWSSQFNQPTAELYQVEVDDQYPYWLYAGQQDNYTTIAVPSAAPSAIQRTGEGWIINTGGCETGPAVPKPGDHNTVYVNCKGVFGVFDKRTGTEKSYPVGAANIYGHNPKDLKYRFQRVAPVHVSPHNPDVVYHGSQFLHKTKDGGQTWETISPDLTAFEADKQVISGSPITRDITGEEIYSTLYSIRESSLKEGLIWTGSNDGLVQVTRDGGQTWTDVTPRNLPKGGRVDAIETSLHVEGKAYIAVLRYQLGDDRPFIYKTTDYGKTWELLTTGTNGIPADFPTRVVREDPVREGLLYAGTEYGMFISFDDGKSWKPFQQNLPITPITDIKIHRGDLVLSTMGRSFWILDNITSLRQPTFNTMTDKPILFNPDQTIRYRYPKIRNDESTFPKYPHTSVIMDYFIPKGNKEGLKLEIVDMKGNTVAAYRSDKAEATKNVTTVEDMATNRIVYLTNHSLPDKEGLNRFMWDMKHSGPWDKSESKRYKNGPIAAPGKYTVKLTVGEEVFSQQFELLIDPRAGQNGVTQADLDAQVEMLQKIGELVSESQQLLDSTEKAKKALKEKDAEEKSKKIEAVLKLLKTESGAYPQPMLADQIQYLYDMINDADQAPGNDVIRRYEELKEQLKEAKAILKD